MSPDHVPASALVTGGAGFLGSHLCERLLGLGYRVVCVDNLSTGRPENVAPLAGHPRLRFAEANVTNGIPLDEPVDVVFHLASPASPRDYLRAPLETLRAGAAGTEHALRAALAWRARFVLTSTSEVYGDPQVHPQRESYWGNVNPVGPRSVYDEAKRYAEALTMAYRREEGLDTAIARVFNTYGPRMRPGDGRVVPTFMMQALNGEAFTVFGDGQQTRSLCYVDDLVNGLISLAMSGEPGPINLGNPEEHTIMEIAAAVAEVAGTTLRVRTRPLPEDDPCRRNPDIGKAVRLLGWTPSTPLAEGLRTTFDWFRESESGAGDRRVLPEGVR